jgi:hypothetical protein
MKQIQYLFIVSSGRTGSTLLLGLLNAHDGFHVKGENFGYFYHHYKAIEALKLSRSHMDEVAPERSPFFGADMTDVTALSQAGIAACRALLDAGCPEHAFVRGFKEVRYDMPDLEDYLAFLASAFAPATFIFLLRDTEDIISSGFWRSLPPGAAMAQVEAMQQRFRNFAEKNPEASFVLDYQDLVTPAEKLFAIFSHFGVEADPSRIASVLHLPHSYSVESVRFYDKSRLQLSSRNELSQNFSAYGFDRLSLTPDGTAIVVQGVLLTHPSRGVDVKTVFATASDLAPSDHSSRIYGQTGIASPGIQQKFPDHPRSAKARFKLAVPMSAGSTEIFAELQNGLVRLGQLTLDAGQAKTFLEPSVGYSGDLKT